MRLYALESTPYKPVSHDPAIKKRVLMDERLSCIRHISHIAFAPGEKASRHSHIGASEVFYCIKGNIVFNVDGRDVTLTQGACLVVEPGEEHEIALVREVTELVYLLTDS